MDLTSFFTENRGELLALLSGFFFAFGTATISLGTVRKRGDNGALLTVIATLVISALIWAIMGSDISVFTSQDTVLRGLFWFSLSGLLATVFGRMFLFKSIQNLGVSRAATIKRLNPFFTSIIAVVILGEVLTPTTGSGMGLIAISILILVRGTLKSWSDPDALPSHHGTETRSAMAFAYGPISALSYAFSYVGRRYGVDNINDGAFGTFVSSVAALLFYLIGAIFVKDYRRAFVEAFTNVNRWQLTTAIFISFGQISTFSAIQYTDVSRVVLIQSMEIFISMFLSVAILKTETKIDAITIFAGVLATVGVALIILA